MITLSPFLVVFLVVHMEASLWLWFQSRDRTLPYGNDGFALFPASLPRQHVPSGGDGLTHSWNGLRGLNPEQSSRSHTSPSKNQHPLSMALVMFRE